MHNSSKELLKKSQCLYGYLIFEKDIVQESAKQNLDIHEVIKDSSDYKDNFSLEIKTHVTESHILEYVQEFFSELGLKSFGNEEQCSLIITNESDKPQKIVTFSFNSEKLIVIFSIVNLDF